jgi:hypothetical protein
LRKESIAITARWHYIAQMNNTNTSEASALKVTRKNGVDIAEFSNGTIRAVYTTRKEMIVEESAGGTILHKYKLGVMGSVRIEKNGNGCWEIESTNDDGYGEGSLFVENMEVVDFDGAFDLPNNIKKILKTLGYALNW